MLFGATFHFGFHLREVDKLHTAHHLSARDGELFEGFHHIVGQPVVKLAFNLLPLLLTFFWKAIAKVALHQCTAILQNVEHEGEHQHIGPKIM